MRTWRWYSKLLFALLVAAFAYCVWPTPWMYFGNGMGGQVGTIVRVNRITGTPYMLHGQDGWQKISKQELFTPGVGVIDPETGKPDPQSPLQKMEAERERLGYK